MSDVITDFNFHQSERDGHYYARFNPDDFYTHVKGIIPRKGVLVDVGGGCGRDAMWLNDLSGHKAHVINIEPSADRLSEAEELSAGRFETRDNWVDAAFPPARPDPFLFLNKALQDLPRTQPAAPVQADFVLCNAVLMFIARVDLPLFMQGLKMLAKPGAPVLITLKTEGLRVGMGRITEDDLLHLSQKAGFNSFERLHDQPDSLGRDFSWQHYILKHFND